MSSDERAVRDALEHAQGRVKALDAEADALWAELQEEKRRREQAEAALAAAERRQLPTPSEQREVMALRAQVQALKLAQSTLTDTVKRLELEKELLLKKEDASERLALFTELQRLRDRLAVLEAAMSD